MSSPWEKWYIANDEWGNISQNIWNWMEKKYDLVIAQRMASSYRGLGGGHGFRSGGGASPPKSPQNVQSWKSKADEVIKYWYEEYEKKTAGYLQPKFEQWIKAQYEAGKVNPSPNKPPKPRS